MERQEVSEPSPCRWPSRSGQRSPACAAAGTSELVRSLGADDVIDYTRAGLRARRPTVRRAAGSDREPFARRVQACAYTARDLRPRRSQGHRPLVWPSAPVQGAVRRRRSCARRCAYSFASTREPISRVLTQLVEAGDIQPVIDRHYDLAQVREAFTSLERGHARGKTIITISAVAFLAWVIVDRATPAPLRLPRASHGQWAALLQSMRSTLVLWTKSARSLDVAWRPIGGSLDLRWLVVHVLG